MLPFEDRYTRQRRLDEVGPEGQQRLQAAAQVLARHDAVELEVDYLRRAGVQQLRFAPDAAAPEFPWSDQFQFTGPSLVARGAHAALARIRAILARQG
jgi:hypothetical protein